MTRLNRIHRNRLIHRNLRNHCFLRAARDLLFSVVMVLLWVAKVLKLVVKVSKWVVWELVVSELVSSVDMMFVVFEL